MVKHVIAPNTFSKRGKSFQAKTFHGKEGYAGWVNELQEKHRIDLMKLLRRIETGQRRIKKFKNLSQKEILRREALFINRQAAYLTDAVIDQKIGAEKYLSMKRIEKSKIWAKNFSEIMERLIMPKIKEIQLKEVIEKMDFYFALPENIHKRRGGPAVWPRLKKIRDEIIANNINPRENLLNQIDKIMFKRKQGENYKVKAMDVCVAASIYADIMKKSNNARWTASYREAMEIVFSKISVDEKLVESIIQLSKTNPQKD